MQALRAATRDAHDRLEDVVDVGRRTADAERYAELLACLRSVYAPLEDRLDATRWTPTVLPDWTARRKTAWLDADLAAMSAPLVRDAPVPSTATLEDVVGVAYVMEGATLGGAVVVRGLAAGLPRRFFSSYGPRRGTMWRAFRAHVEHLPALDEGTVVAAARSAFAAFERPFAVTP